MNCIKCGAPLPPPSHICSYCKTANDTDLHALKLDMKDGPVSDRLCPRCQKAMFLIDLQVEHQLRIDRCRNCLGIFFDPKELETLISSTVKHVHEPDHKRLTKLIEEEAPATTGEPNPINCPDCGILMQSQNYDTRCNVIAHRCLMHGIWLDGGDLARLLKWAKAGGRIYAEQRRQAGPLGFTSEGEARIDARQKASQRMDEILLGPEWKKDCKPPEEATSSLIHALGKIFLKPFQK